MGQTQIVTKTEKNQWWRNICQVNVLVRDSCSLHSTEIFTIPPNQYVQQGGHCEVFISGRAKGLQRMPVLPRGWVTVDATEVFGPKYLEPVRTPRWKVVFSVGSSTNDNDVIVRKAMLLDSEEVGGLVKDTCVIQAGPQVLSDGILRMPICLDGLQMSGAYPSVSTGWVTCDARAQGGPQFFEPCCDDEEAAPFSHQTEAEGQDGAEKHHKTWKIRTFRVVNVDMTNGGIGIPVVSHAEVYSPNMDRKPPDDIVRKWLQNGDVVHQIRHSKKVRNHKVMPVRIDDVEGWVTRGIVCKNKGQGSEKNKNRAQCWFEEIQSTEESFCQYE